jgi:hypothetical protein
MERKDAMAPRRKDLAATLSEAYTDAGASLGCQRLALEDATVLSSRVQFVSAAASLEAVMHY